MDIQSAGAARGIPLTHLVKARFSPGKIALPVRKSQYLYSNLKHITGVPADRQAGGYSLIKLKALDNLIERLGSFGRKPERPDSAAGESSANITALIEQYAADLHQIAADTSPYNTAGAVTGLLVNLTV
jgi:hypothetical protein